MKRASVGSDPARESLADPEMGCFPCHLFIEPDQAFRNTRNRNFVRMCRGLHVQVDVARKVKTAVDWRVYPRFQIDNGQASIFVDL